MKRSTLLLLLIVLLAATACGGNGASGDVAESESGQAGDPVDGKKTYGSLCVACHGEDARGVEGLGRDLVTSEFMANSTDDELVEFIQVGRPVTDPDNITGVDMPPRGGNPALTDEDIENIVAYLRTLRE